MTTDCLHPLAARVALVTGASRGIGAACARAFLAAGASVSIGARDEHALYALAEALATSGRVLPLATDVTDAATLSRLVEATVERFGRLDAAVNNPGTIHRPTPIADLDPDEFDRVVAADLRGVYLSMRAEIPPCSRLEAGRSSTSPQRLGSRAPRHVCVRCREGGGDRPNENRRTRLLGTEHQGRRNCPWTDPGGPILNAPTQVREQVAAMLPLRRIGRPEEVAAAAVWLSSAQSSFVTGTTLAIDGGQTGR